MTDGLNSSQIKILTWVVYALLFILTSSTAWLCLDRIQMPNGFVRLERYKADQCRHDAILVRVEEKIDQLIMAERRK